MAPRVQELRLPSGRASAQGAQAMLAIVCPRVLLKRAEVESVLVLPLLPVSLK